MIYISSGNLYANEAEFLLHVCWYNTQKNKHSATVRTWSWLINNVLGFFFYTSMVCEFKLFTILVRSTLQCGIFFSLFFFQFQGRLRYTRVEENQTIIGDIDKALLVCVHSRWTLIFSINWCYESRWFKIDINRTIGQWWSCASPLHYYFFFPRVCVYA